MQQKIINAFIGVAIILTLPYLFNFDWTRSDYVIAGILLFTTATIFVLVTSKIKSQSKKITAGIIILLIFLYIWAELAVGIFTNLGS